MQNNTEKQVYAGFFVRLAAYLIDWIVVTIALLVIRIPVWIASVGGVADFVFEDFIFQYSIYDIALYVLKVVYFALLTYYTGATLGKRVLNLRVVSKENRKPTLFEIVFRESVGKFLSGLICSVGYLLVGLDKQKRGLHDMLSDTYVVYHHQKTVHVPTPVVYQKVNYAVPVPPQSMQGQPMQGQQPMQNQFVPSQPTITEEQTALNSIAAEQQPIQNQIESERMLQKEEQQNFNND